MLHEIEGVEREIREREDQILVEMEKAEGARGRRSRREEALFKTVEERGRAERQGAGAPGRRASGAAGRSWPRSATAWRPPCPKTSWRSSSAWPSCAGPRWPGGRRRHVHTLPREAAAADVGGPEVDRRGHPMPGMQPHPVLRGAGSRGAPAAVSGACRFSHLHLYRRGEPGQSRRGRLRRPRRRRIGRRARRPLRLPGPGQQQRRRIPGPDPCPALGPRPGRAPGQGLLRLRAGGAADRRPLQGETPGHDPPAPRGLVAAAPFEEAAVRHVRREQNREADRLANQALDEKASKLE